MNQEPDTAGLSARLKQGYLFQAVSIALWWVAMSVHSDVYAAFEFPGVGRVPLFAFVLPDLVVVSLVSILIAIHPSRVLQGVVLGGFSYGALWCVAASVTTGGGYLSSLVMILGTVFNVFLFMGSTAFNVCRSTNPVRNATATFLQSAILWSTTLVLFPLAIVHALGDWPVEFKAFTTTVGVLGFLACSALGIWSAAIMVSKGEGTPLPLDAPKRLVLTGPYAYVRAPMAIAGLGQGFSVSILLTSIPVAIYVVLGMFVWNYFVRPEEERHLQQMFGVNYEKYRANVRCWLPRTTPYIVDRP